MKIFEGFNLSAVSERFQGGARDHIRLTYMSEYPETSCFFSKSTSLEIRMLTEDVYESCSTLMRQVTGLDSFSTFFDSRAFVIQNPQLMMMVSNSSHVSKKENIKTNRFFFEVFGEQTLVKQLVESINQRFFDKSYTRINWFFKDSYGIEDRPLYVDHDQKIYDECYPWLGQGVDTFIDGYLRSTASVMLLYGPPGTGKTSFLKHMICSRKLQGIVTYDEAVLSDDRFFIDFLTDDENDIMIVEDADALLSNRESDQNKIMSKFLNVSDGLVKVDSKKMVFTTNISQLARVDQALLRRGRCFAAVEFRKLTASEARDAARATGQLDQDWSTQEQWSLAEIFNTEDTTVVEAPRRAFGFAR